ADRYVVLAHGVIVASGNRADLQNHDQLMAAYLDAA
ncbi:MAG: ABC transporter ATP-binding protein, partial [Rhodocyclaceae bacterium]